MTSERPASVLAVTVLLYVLAALAILSGIAMMVESNSTVLQDQTSLSNDELFGYGTSVLIVGVITGFLAAGLEHGSNVVRWIIAVAMAYFLLVGVLALFSFESAARWQGFWAVTISIVVLALLFGNKDAQRYFADA